MESIKVGLADDHRLFRKLTVSFLGTVPGIDPEIVEAENGKDLLRRLRSEPVDVVLMDISMPGMGGDEAAAVILRRYTNTKVVILSVNDSPVKVKEMMDLGVHGYLLKDCEPSEMVRAIIAVIEKDFYKNELTNSALEIARVMGKTGRERLIEELTAREKEILLHICSEYTTKEISERLSISVKTVENHRMNMLQKLSVRNTVGLVKYAYENHILPLN